MAEVTTGVRGPEKPGPRQERASRVPAAPGSGEVIYESQIKSYRLQITAPADFYNPKTGKTTPAAPKVAQFRDFVFRTKDAESIEILDDSDKYGLTKMFWRQEELTAAVAKSKDDEIRKFVEEQPEKIAQMLKEITGAKNVSALAKDKAKDKS